MVAPRMVVMKSLARYVRIPSRAFWAASIAATLSSCTGISIAPSCPNALEVGESGVVAANEINPGAIARYEWTAIPIDRGNFDDATLPITRFNAVSDGEVTIRLTASDGLYQVISQCRITVGDAGDPPDPPTMTDPPVVSLLVSPSTTTVGTEVLLTCTSSGATPAAEVFIDQTGGPAVEVFDIIPGVSSFDTTEEGTFTFQCVGVAADGTQSAPSTGSVEVSAGGGGRPPGGGRG